MADRYTETPNGVEHWRERVVYSQCCDTPHPESYADACDAQPCATCEAPAVFRSGIVADGEAAAAWWWWACFPGCLPDGDPMGPYDSERAALAAAWGDDDDGDPDPDDEAEARAEALEHAARALYVCAFASACDEADGDGCEPAEDMADDYADHPDRAGAGADWMDTTAHHTTPPEATAKAEEILAEFEATNGRTIGDALREWLAFDHKYARTEPDAEKFGHYLAMESMGHGVGLWDDIRNGPRYDERGAAGFAVGHTGEHFGAWDFEAPPRGDE